MACQKTGIPPRKYRAKYGYTFPEDRIYTAEVSFRTFIILINLIALITLVTPITLRTLATSSSTSPPL
jgi:hypothetical protein